MFKLISLAVLIAISAHATNVLADEDDSYTNYDTIVNQLKASAEDVPPAPKATDEWDDVALHAGVALNTSYVSLHLPDGTAASGLFKGLQFNVGMNLYSRLVRAEAAYSAFQREDFSGEINGDLREFELRLLYLPNVGDRLTLRAGTGLAARYLDINSQHAAMNESFSQATPTAVLLLGLERKVNDNVSFGPDLSYHSALTQDTYDKSSWDASFRLNATF